MNDYRFADMTDIPHDCRDCKHNDKQWYEMPCDACCPAHCGFEKKELNRYIDADKLKADIRPFAEYESNRTNKDWARRIEVVIDNQPTADVVEVVRCKDCKRHIENDVGDIFCNYHGISMLENDFCSYGERKE